MTDAANRSDTATVADGSVSAAAARAPAITATIAPLALAAPLLIAGAHLAYWGGGAALAVRQGAMDVGGAIAITLWLAALTGWGLTVRRLSRSGWLATRALPSRPGLWLPSSSVMLTIAAILCVPPLLAALASAATAWPATAAVWLHGVRLLAFGTVVKARRGEIPRRIGYGVGGADTVFGALSIAIAATGGFPSWGAAVVWNCAGALILLAMVPLLDATLPRRPGTPRHRRDARAVLDDPLVLAPAVLATLFLIQHGVGLWILQASAFAPDLLGRRWG